MENDPIAALVRSHEEVLEGRKNGSLLATPLKFPRKGRILHRGGWAIKHGNIIVNKRFKKQIDAWDWAMENYKGSRNWKIVSVPEED